MFDFGKQMFGERIQFCGAGRRAGGRRLVGHRNRGTGNQRQSGNQANQITHAKIESYVHFLISLK
jgi:hypothetical protein